MEPISFFLPFRIIFCLFSLSVSSGPFFVPLTSHPTNHVGYRRMTQSQLSALAVVNDAGAVVGTLSASDLRGVLADQVSEKETDKEAGRKD